MHCICNTYMYRKNKDQLFLYNFPWGDYLSAYVTHTTASEISTKHGLSTCNCCLGNNYIWWCLIIPRLLQSCFCRICVYAAKWCCHCSCNTRWKIILILSLECVKGVPVIPRAVLLKNQGSKTSWTWLSHKSTHNSDIAEVSNCKVYF